MNLLLGVLLGLVFTAGVTPVFAVNPYVAGSPDFAAETASQVWFYTDFKGVHDTSQWTGSVQSNAAVDGSDNMNGYIYQQAAVVDTNERVESAAQVWFHGSLDWTCSTHWTGGCPELDDDVDDVDFVYQTAYWNGSPAKVTYVWETHLNAGGSNFDSGNHVPTDGDDSENFLVGEQTVSSDSYWHYQVGIESSDEANNVDIHQFDIGWVENSGGVTNGKDKDFYTVEGPPNSGDSHASRITHDGSGWGVGEEDYNDIDADYDLKSGSSMPDGEVEWFYSTTNDIDNGVQLWD